MKIISFNVNGIRSAINKGFFEWLEKNRPDVLCVQEIKADTSQMELNRFEEVGYHYAINPAEKKGYSGVATFSLSKPDFVEIGIGNTEFDKEGRLIRTDFGELSIINSYFPSGTMGDVRQDVKMRYLDEIFDYLQKLKKQRPNIILSGDFNICHEEIDISNPQNKKGVSGFLPEERAWITKLLNSGFIDTYRFLNPGVVGYSWWSYRAGARAKNLGWRIDYHMVSLPLKENIKTAFIQADVYMSDHCPIFLEIEPK